MKSSDRWPDDADGDVLRRMSDSGFDFAAPHQVEFNVDFASWPPSRTAIRWLEAKYQSITLYPPDSQSGGYVLVRITAPVTYEFIVTTQKLISDALAADGGTCDSWGVLH